RSAVGTGFNVQIAGFVIGEGSVAKPVIIRAAGPALADFLGSSSAAPLPDPHVDLYRQTASALLAANDDWDAALAADFAAVSAFPWPEGSADAALRATLEPDIYTAVV